MDAKTKRPRISRQRLISIVVSVAVIVAGVVLYATNRNGGSSGPSASPSVANLAGRVPFSKTPAETWQPATSALAMPKAVKEGPYSAAEVASALSRARIYLLAAHTSAAVLTSHNLSGLRALVTAQTPATPQHLYVVELAPGNTVAAPPRLTGTVHMAFVPQAGKIAEHLEVTTNLIWAYALAATYPVYITSDGVVTVHENMQLDFYLDADMDGPQPKIAPTRDQSLMVNGDCAYFDAGLVALPRVDDPKRAGGSVDADQDQYDLNANVTAGGFGCR